MAFRSFFGLGLDGVTDVSLHLASSQSPILYVESVDVLDVKRRYIKNRR